MLCGFCDGLYIVMWFEQEWCLVICCKVFGGEHVGETCNTHVENEKCTPNMAGKHQGKIKAHLGIDTGVIPNASTRNGV